MSGYKAFGHIVKLSRSNTHISLEQKAAKRYVLLFNY